MPRSNWYRLLIGAAGLALCSCSAAADPVADFYRSNPINIYVSSAPGGGYDNYARLLARHLGGHIPGTPTVVVKNMPGAGGSRAANYVYNVAAKDGSSIVMPQNTLTIDQFTGMPSVKFDMRQFEWLGSMNINQSICIFDKRAAPSDPTEFFKKKIVVGASGGVTASPALIASLSNQLAGTKFEIINGYEGTNVVFLAIERGEIDGMCGIGWDSVKVQAEERIRKGDLVVGLDVGITQDEELKAMNVPFLLGLMPDGVEKKALALVLSAQYYGRPFALAPGVPSDRRDAIRAAFAATMTDEVFLNEAKRTNMQMQPISPAQVLNYIKMPFDAPAAIQDRAMAELRKAGWSGGAR